MYPNFVYRKCIYQQTTQKIINTDANVFINNYQVNLGGWILQLGKNPLVKNTPPIPLNVAWGAYSSQYPGWLLYYTYMLLNSKDAYYTISKYVLLNSKDAYYTISKYVLLNSKDAYYTTSMHNVHDCIVIIDLVKTGNQETNVWVLSEGMMMWI